MSKWKCEICGKEFDNFQAQGFDNKVYCPLCFFKEKTNRLEKIRTQLQQENKQLKEMFEDSKTYSKEFLYKHNKNLLEANERLYRENQLLKDKINTYENPEDLTLMFMYCDEKAKDKIKQLKEVIEEVREYIEKHILATETEEVLLQILDKVKEDVWN